MKRSAAVLLACFAAGDAAGQSLLHELVKARDVICDFRTTGTDTDKDAADPARDRDMMLVIEAIDAKSGRARVVTSRTIGRRRVQLYEGETGVHFVEDRQDSVVVTTLVACEQWKNKGGRESCAHYAALNSWHFDTSVHRDADRAFRKLGTSSYRGTCEPWDPG